MPRTSPIRVASITYDWFPYEPRAFRLAQAAVDAGYIVDVICPRRPNEKHFEVLDEFHIYRVPMNRSIGASLPFTVWNWCRFLLLAAIRVSWLHLRHPYTIVVVHNMPDFLVFSTVFPKLFGARILLDMQDLCPELLLDRAHGPLRSIIRPLAVLQECLSIVFADHIVTIGWTVEELLLQRGVPKGKLTSIINSADPKIFPSSCRPVPPKSQEFIEAIKNELDEQPFILLYHGSIDQRQGLDTAIRALAMVHEIIPQVRLDIKGFGDTTHLKQLAVELGIENSVVFSERCPVGEVVNFIVHGHVGIIPYRPDGYMELVLPTKAFEFAWMHCPMIASNVRGIRSLFRPESIVLCNPKNPASFANAIIDLYQHPEKRAQMVSNAAEDYLPYRWEIMEKRYQRLLAFLSDKPEQGQITEEEYLEIEAMND